MKLSWAIPLIACCLILGFVSVKLWSLTQHWYAQGKVMAALGTDRVDFPKPDWPEGATRVLFVGDSRIAQWPLPEAPTGTAFLNRGIGGETSSHLVARFAELLNETKPDHVVMGIGINDLYAAAIDETLRMRITDNLIFNTKILINMADSQLDSLVILEILHPANPGLKRRALAWDDRIHSQVEAANQAIRALSDPPRVKVFDPNSVLGASADQALRSEFAKDAFHLTPTAYARLSEALLKEVSFQ